MRKKKEYNDHPYFYYLRDHENKPIITVCLLDCLPDSASNLYARGVSICHPFDQPNKKTGRAKALGRARQAAVLKEDVRNPMSETAMGLMYAFAADLLPEIRKLVPQLPGERTRWYEYFLGRYGILPTEFEKSILRKAKRDD